MFEWALNEQRLLTKKKRSMVVYEFEVWIKRSEEEKLQSFGADKSK